MTPASRSGLHSDPEPAFLSAKEASWKAPLTTSTPCASNSACRAKPRHCRHLSASTRPLAEAIELADAPFWSASQASFLREQLNKDADWAEVVDQLNLLLRRPR